MEIERVVLIGSGNVSTHLGRALHWSRFKIEQVYSRNPANAAKLAEELRSTPTSDLNEVIKDADLYIIGVSDDAIIPIAKQLRVNGIVVHTSGSAEIETVAECSDQYGVFYPLQTFSKDKDVELEGIPILVEGNTEEVQETLFDLGNRLTHNAKKLTTEQRLRLHIAAVFACNFTNHMYAIAEMILQESGMELKKLKHLINEATAKAMEHSPAEVQTGPAVRHDDVLIERHIELLKGDPKFSEIYKLLSETIQIMNDVVNENK